MANLTHLEKSNCWIKTVDHKLRVSDDGAFWLSRIYGLQVKINSYNCNLEYQKDYLKR